MRGNLFNLGKIQKCGGSGGGGGGKQQKCGGGGGGGGRKHQKCEVVMVEGKIYKKIRRWCRGREIIKYEGGNK